ncbi:hypothetical protein KJ966_08925 [bacterium]|nr:hypothetical protein [bacterium]
MPRDTIFAAFETKPNLLECKAIYERVVAKLLDIIHRFDDDMGDIQ